MYDITLLCLIKASVTLHCEIIVSHGFNICFDEKSLEEMHKQTIILLFYI